MKRRLLSLCLGLIVVTSPALAGGDDGLPLPPVKPLLQETEAQAQAQEEEADVSGEQPAKLRGDQALLAIEGTWRLDGLREPSQPVAGTMRVFLADDGLRYERRCRTETMGPAQIESGRVLRRGPTLFFKADPAPGGTGLEHVLRGEQTGAANEPTALGAYRPLDDNYRGLHRASDGRRSKERLSRWSPSEGNHAELLIDGQAFESMEEAIRAAKHTIDIQTFQWADDETGREMAALLAQKVEEGVRVRCLIDASSKTVNWMVSFHIPEPKVDITGQKYHGWKVFPTSFFKKGLDTEMQANGIELIHAHGYLAGMGNSVKGMFTGIWNGIGRLWGRKPPRKEKRGISAHDHRKLMIVDEQIAFCGGMNIAREYRYDWHDVVARVEGPAAYDLHEMFVDRWKAAGGEGELERKPVELWDCPEWSGDVKIEAIGSLPGLAPTLKERYLEEINKAERRILIEMAYFLDDDIIDALGKAAQRGIRTLVIVPSDRVNDVYLVKEAFAWMHNDVLKSGIELYFYQPRLNHSKVAAFDGVRSTVGSCNLDNMALTQLAEANLWIDDARFTRDMEERIFREDLPKCERAKPIKRGWGGKLRSKFFHMFRGLL